MSAKDLVGNWRLRSWVIEGADGKAVRPMGESPVGVICYTADGFVHVHIMRNKRPPHASGDPLGGTREEDIRSARTHISYSGRWHVERNVVFHDVSISSFPNWAPSRQKRFFRFEDGFLELSTGLMAWDGQEICHKLLWERAKKW